MTTYAIVYGTVSKMIRRVIADDDGLVATGTMPDGITPAVICTHHNGKPNSYHPIASGESVLIDVPPSAITSANPARWTTVLHAATGVVPPVIVCALIDQTNTVTQLIHADPAIDAAPAGFAMVQSYATQIAPGYSYDPISGLFSSPQFTIPGNAPGNKGTAIPKVVPAAVIPKP